MSSAARAVAMVIAVAAAGCGRREAQEITDGGEIDRAPADGATPDLGGPLDAGSDAALPSPGAVRLVTGRARLVGMGESACSAGTGDRWCAFSRPGRTIGKTELWVVNVTRAASGEAPVTCDGADPGCLRLTEDLWIGRPTGAPSFPSVDRFTGDTLVFHAGAAADLEEYRGPIFAWRPGWAAPRAISGPAGYACIPAAATNVDVYFCLENLTEPDVEPFQLDLTAGRLADATPTRVARVTPQHAGSTSVQFQVAFSPRGDYLAWSTGGPTVQDAETLYALALADLGAADRRLTTVVGASRWAIAADGAKVYYLRDFNYPKAGVDPSGTLAMADFPDGRNEVVIAPQVAALQALSAPGGTDGGIAFFDGVRAGRATFEMLRDRAHPDRITTVVRDVLGTAGLSNDLRFLAYHQASDPRTGTTDARIARTDGSGVSCALTTAPTADRFGAAFSDSGALVFWVDNEDFAGEVADGWVANPDGCTGRRRWIERLDLYVLRGNDGMIFTSGARDDAATLHTLPFAEGSALGPPRIVASPVSRVFAPLPAFEGAVYTIPGVPPTLDGLYYSPTRF